MAAEEARTLIVYSRVLSDKRRGSQKTENCSVISKDDSSNSTNLLNPLMLEQFQTQTLTLEDLDSAFFSFDEYYTASKRPHICNPLKSLTSSWLMGNARYDGFENYEIRKCAYSGGSPEELKLKLSQENSLVKYALPILASNEFQFQGKVFLPYVSVEDGRAVLKLESYVKRPNRGVCVNLLCCSRNANMMYSCEVVTLRPK